MSIQEHSTALRIELKQWEKHFTTSHNGRKPGRDDIKGDAQIAAKYKEYDRIRSLLAGKALGVSTPRATKRQRVDYAFASPSKPPAQLLPKPVTTPSRGWRSGIDENSVVAQSPSVSPSQVFPTFVGPTPQKDGIPLGLFEFLSPYQQSPSTKVGNHRPALASLCANVPATPTKRPCNNVSTDDPPDTIGRFRFTRTPTSTGKRFLLDTFVTPQKDRHSAEADATPSSSMRHLQTPTFLRRDSARLNVLAEQNETKGSENPTRAAEPLFKKRRGFGRSLSAIIRDLKKNEDEEFADEMEAQRQMEMETHARTGLAQADQNLGLKDKNGSRDSQVLVQDSQPAMSLGPDGSNEPENSDESSPEADVSGQPRKPWKKKGMKRQTKRVNIRPVASKPKPQPVVSLQHDKEDSSSAIVLESQLAAPRNKDSEDEDGHSDFAPRNIEVASQSRAHSKSTKLSGPSKDGRDTQSNSPKKSKRKVNPQAHANYRRLKIKSKNGKGQGRGRFGRGHR